MNKHTIDYQNQSAEIELNGNKYPDYYVDSVKADVGNKDPYSFVCANSYTIKLTDENEKPITEIIYRKDSETGLVEFLSDVKFPG